MSHVLAADVLLSSGQTVRSVFDREAVSYDGRFYRTIRPAEWSDELREGMENFLPLQLNERPVDYRDNEAVIFTAGWWNFLLAINDFNMAKIAWLFQVQLQGVLSYRDDAVGMSDPTNIKFHYPICFAGGNLVKVLGTVAKASLIETFAVGDTPPDITEAERYPHLIHTIYWQTGAPILGGIRFPILTQRGTAYVESAGLVGI